MSQNEKPFSIFKKVFDRRQFFSIEPRTTEEWHARFGLASNGYILKNGNWIFQAKTLEPMIDTFKGQKVSFFGPGSSDTFFSDEQAGKKHMGSVFRTSEVATAIEKYRATDEDQAKRISFIFGGIVRHMDEHGKNHDQIVKAVKYTATKTMFGDQKSGDAIAAAVAMYIISGGSLKENKDFDGYLYHMAEAVRKDPIKPAKTKDLGISQVARFMAFENAIQGKPDEQFPDISNDEKAFMGSPTVGAEFHLLPTSSIWERLAILNESQYQKGSYIQFSRNDRNVIEVRMNPSIYPVTIANWQHMKLFFPELKESYFTATINRASEQNFSWDKDTEILTMIKALGMLTFANSFDSIPRSGPDEEINFGNVYLGQTFKMLDGKKRFSGHWSGGERGNGQMAVYTGFGSNFPDLMYYSTMVLTNPRIIDSELNRFLSDIKTLKDAMNVSSRARINAFKTLQEHITQTPELNRAFESGRRITEVLLP